MSYIEQFEQELLAKLQTGEDTTAVVHWVSEKVLESFKNGCAAGRKGKAGKNKEAGQQDGPSGEAM